MRIPSGRLFINNTKHEKTADNINVFVYLNGFVCLT